MATKKTAAKKTTTAAPPVPPAAAPAVPALFTWADLEPDQLKKAQQRNGMRARAIDAEVRRILGVK